MTSSPKHGGIFGKVTLCALPYLTQANVTRASCFTISRMYIVYRYYIHSMQYQ